MSNELVKGIKFDTVRREGIEYEAATPFGVMNALVPTIDFNKYQESILMQQAIDTVFAQRVCFLIENAIDEGERFSEIFNNAAKKYIDPDDYEYCDRFEKRDEFYTYGFLSISHQITNQIPALLIRSNYLNMTEDEVQVIATAVASIFYQQISFKISLKSKVRQENETLRMLEVAYELSHDVYVKMVEILAQLKEEALTGVNLPVSKRDKNGRIINESSLSSLK